MGFELASLSGESNKQVVGLVRRLRADSLLLTSAIRARNEWHWGNKIRLDHLPFGRSGRCAALREGELVSVDCDAKDYLPLCELNFAKKCALANGFYDGEESVTLSGEFIKQKFNAILFQDSPASAGQTLASSEQAFSHPLNAIGRIIFVETLQRRRIRSPGV
jgi:hypothetical protein